MERMVLDAVADFLQDAGLAGERLPPAAQIALGRDRNDAATSLPPTFHGFSIAGMRPA
jgi:hypothetical protein